MRSDAQEEGRAHDAECPAKALERLVVVEAVELGEELDCADEAEGAREAEEADEIGALDRAVAEEAQHRIEGERARKIRAEPCAEVVGCDGAEVANHDPAFLEGGYEGDSDVHHKGDIDNEVCDLQGRVAVASKSTVKC